MSAWVIHVAPGSLSRGHELGESALPEVYGLPHFLKITVPIVCSGHAFNGVLGRYVIEQALDHMGRDAEL